MNQEEMITRRDTAELCFDGTAVKNFMDTTTTEIIIQK